MVAISLLEKKAQKAKKKTPLSYLSGPSQATLILYALVQTPGSCIRLS